MCTRQFWTDFEQYLDHQERKLGKLEGGNHQFSRWINIGSWVFIRIEFYAYSKRTAFAPGKGIGITLLLDSDDQQSGRENVRDRFEELYAVKDSIEREIGEELQWCGQTPAKKRCRVLLFRKNTDPADKNQWADQFAWLYRYLLKFYDTFDPRV